ncbi:MAG: lysophospholipid acyltransferase family protein [Eubacterium sp.]
MIRLFFLILFLILYFIVSLPIQLAEFIIQHFNMDLRNRTSLSFVQFGLRCVSAISGVKLEVHGMENIPQDQAVLFVGNHQSLFDIIVTYPLMKRPTGYIAKKEIKKVPFLSWWMYFVNCIFLDRKNPRNGLKSVLNAAEMIKSGVSIFLFPEGTRSKDGRLHEFKDGGMKIATKSLCPIIPVGIRGTSDLLEKQFPRIKSANVTVSFGKPIYTADMSRAELKGVSQTVREEVSKLIG